jgi:undecaprenyl-diphosphatase
LALPEWLIVIILGIVEGATEFIPVSSTGHLLIFQEWLDYRQSDLFNVVIQSGAVIAVLPLFKDRLRMMADWRSPQSLDFNLKILVGFLITVVGGLTLDKLGIELPETTLPIAGALIIGGILFIVVEKKLQGLTLADCITWPVVFMVATAQILAAVFPGTSRSGATIIFAMLCGLNRVVATEFSFLIGIPTLLAAGAYKILKALNGGATEHWGLLFLGTVVSAIVSFIAVKWLLRYVQTHTFIGFGVYRIILGLVLVWMFFSR